MQLQQKLYDYVKILLNYGYLKVHCTVLLVSSFLKSCSLMLYVDGGCLFVCFLKSIATNYKIVLFSS